jgi:hypothetical protein
VAIKVLVAARHRSVALARFEREAMSVKLSHPNVLSIFEFAQDGSTAFVVTELVTARAARAPRRRSAAPATGRRARAQIARGIAAAHARGIVTATSSPRT